ncbi:MAG: ABC transporter ATP-binding protein [Thermodesulfovibrionales bacterium]|nr:ABC transporter ATP-binding protein [Thermodesulfovibrionales bacterium]
MIEVKGLCFSYEESSKILHDIDFSIAKGEVISILGPNGSGKTTLLRCINGLLKPKGGNIYVNGQDIVHLKRKEIARHIAYVPQDHKSTFPYTVLDVVLLGRTPYIGVFSSPKQSDIKSAYEVLKSVGIEHLSNRPYTHLSGGEMRLVLIARALCSGAGVLLFDEPTSNLDLRHQGDVLRIIKDVSKSKGQSVLMTIHDINLAMMVSDRVILMKNGFIVTQGSPKDVLTRDWIEHTYDCEVDVVNNGNDGLIRLKL